MFFFLLSYAFVSTLLFVFPRVVFFFLLSRVVFFFLLSLSIVYSACSQSKVILYLTFVRN